MVPLGAFTALRSERQEQTLELITLTALSPRRVVIGKLLAQGVKLVTLFAGLAPFIAMSFLLGGVDFATILVVDAGHLHVVAVRERRRLFLSSLVKSRAASGFVLGVIGIVMLLAIVVFGAPRAIYFLMMRGGIGGIVLRRHGRWRIDVVVDAGDVDDVLCLAHRQPRAAGGEPVAAAVGEQEHGAAAGLSRAAVADGGVGVVVHR